MRDCQTIVVSTGGSPANRNRGTATALFRSQVSGGRSGSPTSRPERHLALCRAARGHLDQSIRPDLFPYRASPAFVSDGVHSSMGWQQYSCPLWLSRGNPYILYLKAITCVMPCPTTCFSTSVWGVGRYAEAAGRLEARRLGSGDQVRAAGPITT